MAEEKKKKLLALLLLLLISLNGFSSASAASSRAKIVSGFFSNALAHLLKKLWTITSAPKTVSTGRPHMKFEGGYAVETVFDGSKLGIEPFSVGIAPSGELLVLDSVNSNMYRISLPLSKHSRAKLIAGSAEGYTGHVDGRPREAKMYHPKSFAVDDRGNIYIADTSNNAIRKISDTGVTTIAGGRWNRGHTDGPSEDAKFSNDFEVVYIASSCSLLVVDRGNQAIREIQLHFDDCAYQYGSGFPIGIAVLLAAGFFGYMLALLQRRVGGIVSPNNASLLEPITPTNATMPPSLYQKPIKPSVRPPLIPNEDGMENQEEGLFSSINKLFAGVKSSIIAVPGAMFSGFRKKPKTNQQQNYHHHYNQQQRRTNAWPTQESFEIPAEDEPPPPVEARTPTARKTYAFMTKDPEKIHRLRQGRAFLNGWESAGKQPQQQQQHVHHHQQHLQQHRQQPLGPQTYYEQSCESTNEIVFGAIQESDSKRRAVEMKAVNYGEPAYDPYGLRSRLHYNSYNDGY